MRFNKNKLYCFTPEVMIATFIIEMVLAIYVLIKSIKAKSDLGIVTILVFLAMFQLSEYQICEGGQALFWARVGLFFITFLPIAGIYVVSRINKESLLLKIGVLVSIAFVGIFTFLPDGLGSVTCGGNYVIFRMDSTLGGFYGYYYFGFLLWGIWAALKTIQEEHRKPIQKALKWFIIGYLSFILPLTLVYIIFPITRLAVASIMCGFAVVFAIILAFKIAPTYHKYVKRGGVKK